MASKNKTTIMKKQLLELVLIRGKIKNTNSRWIWFCCTCGKKWHRTTMSGGHFIPQSKWNSTRFELDNTNLQCQSCNARCNQWEQYKHWLYIDQNYYIWRADELHLQSRTPRKWKIFELEEAIDIVEIYIAAYRYNATKIEQEKLALYIKKNSERKKKCKWVLERISKVSGLYL